MGGREVAFFIIDMLSIIIEWYIILKQVICFFCLVGIERSLSDVKFYRAVNKFSLKKRHKIILKYFQRFVGFCNIKTNKHIRGVI